MSFQELNDFLNDILQSGMRANNWLAALSDGRKIQRSFEDQTITIECMSLSPRVYRVIFK
jgi:hypothetical protein